VVDAKWSRVKQTSSSKANRMSASMVPRSRSCDLPPLDSRRGRRTGCSYMKGTVKQDEHGIEDMVDFFMEPREDIQNRVKRSWP
jgi:hypothetical protein